MSLCLCVRVIVIFKRGTTGKVTIRNTVDLLLLAGNEKYAVF